MYMLGWERGKEWGTPGEGVMTICGVGWGKGNRWIRDLVEKEGGGSIDESRLHRPQ